jgi:hypothetical protein
VFHKGHFGDKALDAVKAAKSKEKNQQTAKHVPIAIAPRPDATSIAKPANKAPAVTDKFRSELDKNEAEPAKVAATSDVTDVIEIPPWDTIRRHNAEVQRMKPVMEAYGANISKLLNWFATTRNHEDLLEHDFLINLLDLVRHLNQLQIWGPDFQARIDRMEHNVQKTIELIFSEEQGERSKGKMMLIADIQNVKQQVTFILDFINEIMLPLHQYFSDTDLYRYVITRNDNRGEKHQKMWNERAKIALIDPLLAVLRARMKESEALYQNLFTYNITRKERCDELVGTVASLFQHSIELKEMLSDALLWQDKTKTPQGLTHDFAMFQFQRVKQLDEEFSRILDSLLEAETNIGVVECLLEGTTVPAIEWKPVSQIRNTFAESVHHEQYGRLRKLPEPHEFPELHAPKSPVKDQEETFVNKFLSQLGRSDLRPDLRPTSGPGIPPKKRPASDEIVASTSGEPAGAAAAKKLKK